MPEEPVSNPNIDRIGSLNLANVPGFPEPPPCPFFFTLPATVTEAAGDPPSVVS
jgi:hypothetical protein